MERELRASLAKPRSCTPSPVASATELLVVPKSMPMDGPEEDMNGYYFADGGFCL